MAIELVWKEHFTTIAEESGETESLIFSGILLGNAEAFRWLAKFFEERAEAAERLERHCDEHGYCLGPDPDDHFQLFTRDAPFESELSDDAELRVGHLVPCNRDDTLSKYGVSSQESLLVDRCRRLIERAERGL